METCSSLREKMDFSGQIFKREKEATFLLESSGVLVLCGSLEDHLGRVVRQVVAGRSWFGSCSCLCGVLMFLTCLDRFPLSLIQLLSLLQIANLYFSSSLRWKSRAYTHLLRMPKAAHSLRSILHNAHHAPSQFSVSSLSSLGGRGYR